MIGLLVCEDNLLNFHAGLLQASMSMNSSAAVRAHHQDNITLQVTTTADNPILLHLVELTWYHNGSLVAPSKRKMLSNGNETLSISNFSIAEDGGIYLVQFNKFFVHPYSDYCNRELVSLLRNKPVMKSVVFCVNMGSKCPEYRGLHTISLESVDTDFPYTFNKISLEAKAIVHNSLELERSIIRWYHDGFEITASSSLHRDGNKDSLTQTFQEINVSYMNSGRYEAHLSINLLSVDGLDSICKPYRINPETAFPDIDLYNIDYAVGFIDIEYYEGNKLSIPDVEKNDYVVLNYNFVIV